MAINLLVDVHVDAVIVRQLRLRQVDVATSQELGVDRLPDDSLLEHATQLGRPLFTHDIRFFAMAEKWIAHGKPFCGLIFAHLMQVFSWPMRASSRNRCQGYRTRGLAKRNPALAALRGPHS